MGIINTLEKISQNFVNIFLILLLPPIIFESGYNMQKKPFFRNIGSVMMIAFAGTLIAITFSSLVFYYTGLLGWSYPFSM